ncbi:MAG: dihydrolipoyl dehydrogenase [Syntrophaceae bacterium]|nr:dihydrolipoyl dehydrogenase [Syntrophaceae bacterium]
MGSNKRVVVIGGGPGGYVAAIRASQLGAKVFLIERDRIGGTCLNRGCIPTKALLHDAKLLRSLRGSPVFQSLLREGFNPLELMMDRKEKVVQEMVKGVEMLLDSQRVTVKKACADLAGVNKVILVNGEERKETIEADAIILAPGSKSKALPGLSPDGERILTSDEALEIKRVPREMVVVGGGYIGVEFATLFNALGSKVTIIEILENILSGLEGEIVRNVRRFLERDGMRILTDSRIEDLQSVEEGLRLRVRTSQGIQEVSAEKILLSVGRVPNLELDFLKAGVSIFPAGIRVNSRMETTTANIYAVGDVVGGPLLAYVASEQGTVAAENILGIDRQMEEGPIPISIFTYPEVASVGLTEKEARARGEIEIGRFPFRSNPAALISGERDGLVKVIVSKEDDNILGVHIIGHEASTLISIASAIMKQGVKAGEFVRFIQAHPTSPEALKEALLDIKGMAIHLPRPIRAKA